VTTTINIYVKMVTQDAEEAMKKLEKKCSLVVPPKLFPNCSSSHQNWEQVGNGSARKALPLEAVRENLAERGGDLSPRFRGSLVLRGKLPLSPLVPRAFKLDV
jgi:hypothetical protein